MASIKLAGDTSGEITISAPAVAGTTTLELPATSSTLATQNALGVRNLIINGDFQIWQRSTSYTGFGYGSADRFYNQNAGTSEQSTDVPSGQTGYSLKYTAPDSGNFRGIVTRLESKNVEHLSGKEITVSFWVKLDAQALINNSYLYIATPNTGNDNYSGGVTQIGSSFSYGSGLTANTWTRVSYTFTAPSSITKGVHLAFNVNGGGTLSGAGVAHFKQIQLEVGDTATPFEHRPYDMELARCQRYFQILKAINIAGYSAGVNESIFSHYPLKVTMRTAPTIAIISTGTTSRLTSLSAHTISDTAVGFWVVANGAGFAGVYGLAIAHASSDL